MAKTITTKVRKILEEKLRDEIECYITDGCGEEIDEEFVKEEIHRIIEAAIEDLPSEEWDDIEGWYDDWFRELIAGYGKLYELYHIKD